MQQIEPWEGFVEQVGINAADVSEACKAAIKLATQVFSQPDAAQAHYEAFQKASDEVTNQIILPCPHSGLDCCQCQTNSCCLNNQLSS